MCKCSAGSRDSNVYMSTCTRVETRAAVNSLQLELEKERVVEKLRLSTGGIREAC